MPSKYSALKNQFQQRVPEDATFAEKVSVRKARYMQAGTNSTAQASRALMSCIYDKEQHEECISELNIDIATYKAIILTLLEQRNEDSFKNEFGTFSAIVTPSAKVVDPDEFRRWIEANGMHDLLSVPASRAGMIVKEHALEGKPLPPGTELTVYTELKITKTKGQ